MTEHAPTPSARLTGWAGDPPPGGRGSGSPFFFAPSQADGPSTQLRPLLMECFQEEERLKRKKWMAPKGILLKSILKGQALSGWYFESRSWLVLHEKPGTGPAGWDHTPTPSLSPAPVLARRGQGFPITTRTPVLQDLEGGGITVTQTVFFTWLWVFWLLLFLQIFNCKPTSYGQKHGMVVKSAILRFHAASLRRCLILFSLCWCDSSLHSS